MDTKTDKIVTTMLGIILAVIAVLTFVLVVRFMFGGPEDTWICSRGVWVMHGKPAAAKPTTSCKK